jgi:hypothetical protein
VARQKKLLSTGWTEKLKKNFQSVHPENPVKLYQDFFLSPTARGL